MTPQERSVYQLAENLGMTVTRLKREMTMSEYFGWVAFYSEKAEGGEKPKTLEQVRASGPVLKGFA